MVSMVEVAISKIDNETTTDLVVPKREPAPDGPGSMSSSASTPEPEGETLTQDVAQTQKRRKGGRKPVGHEAGNMALVPQQRGERSSH